MVIKSSSLLGATGWASSTIDYVFCAPHSVPAHKNRTFFQNRFVAWTYRRRVCRIYHHGRSR